MGNAVPPMCEKLSRLLEKGGCERTTYEEKIIWHEIETEKFEDGILKVYGELPEAGQELIVATKLGSIDLDECMKNGDLYDLDCYGWGDIVAWAKIPSYRWGTKE